MAGMIALARRTWRQLTSMRTALVLLFLLAVAAIPGSVLPQRHLNQEKVADYLRTHGQTGRVLDRLWAFDVYSSPWFSAIYLLLFASLVGCLVPRMADHIAALRRVPPDAPARLERLPAHAVVAGAGGAAGVAGAAAAERLRALLRARRFRAVVRPAASAGEGFTVSAEKGYLKESGNLLFHFALLGLLVGVASGSMWGWHANRLVVAGPDQAFCSSLQQYDDYGLGPWVQPSDLPRFCLQLDEFAATYAENGQPLTYRANVHYGQSLEHPARLEVNDPLRLAGGTVYLLGHGYAPVVRYTDRYGRSQTSVSAFLPQDGMLTSNGVVIFPDANVNPATGAQDSRGQVGFAGFYLPTTPSDPSVGRSAFPAERSPALMLQQYVGDLGLDSGIPQSVYQLNERQIALGRLVKTGEPQMMRPGDTVKLDDGGQLEFVGTRQWITLAIRHDPGEKPVLVAAICLLAGLILSLTGRRRRIWFRVGPGGVTAGGLPRSDYQGFAGEFDEIVRAAREAVGAAADSGELVPAPAGSAGAAEKGS